MGQLNALSTGRKLILGAGLLLFIDTFLTWQKVEVKIADVTAISATANAWHGFWGVLLGLLTIAVLAWVAARALGVALPAYIPGGLVTLALGGLILIFAVLKNLTDDFSAWGSIVGIVLAAVVAAGAWLTFQESGEPLPRLAAATPGGGGAPSAPAPPSAPVTPAAPYPPAGEERPSAPADPDRF